MCIQSNVDPVVENIPATECSTITHRRGASSRVRCSREGALGLAATYTVVHPHRGMAGSDGGSRDLWLPREVTQRLIYFTGGLPPPPLLRFLLSHHQRRAYPPCPFPSVASEWPSVAREGPAADIVPHTRPVSRLYTRLHRIYMRKESSPPFPPRCQRPPALVRCLTRRPSKLLPV